MSSRTHTNGVITLKSFAELASVLDLESLPPGRIDGDHADAPGTVSHQFGADASSRQP